jgi:hypothetical protein
VRNQYVVDGIVRNRRALLYMKSFVDGIKGSVEVELISIV